VARNSIVAVLVLAAWSVARGAVEKKEDVSVFASGAPVLSAHFRLRHEDRMAPAGVVYMLENLHARLSLDLGLFQAAAPGRVLDVYLYASSTSYQNRAAPSPWAAAHIRGDAIYGYDSPAFQQTLAHELGHHFFGGYFLLKSTAPPLWLNEGVAQMMEWEYGMEKQSGESDRWLSREGPIPFDAFLKFTYRDGTADAAEGEDVTKWYRQAMSVTRYLMREFPPVLFLRFCENLRAGKNLDAALAAGYGAGLPDAAALERLWRASLGKNNN
jgi:hypothetical protein